MSYLEAKIAQENFVLALKYSTSQYLLSSNQSCRLLVFMFCLPRVEKAGDKCSPAWRCLHDSVREWARS